MDRGTLTKTGRKPDGMEKKKPHRGNSASQISSRELRRIQRARRELLGEDGFSNVEEKVD